MARALERLNALQVKKLAIPGYYCDGGGLYLQVSKSGTKSWIMRYTLAGKSCEMGLGSYSTWTLAEARQRAIAQRKLLTDGINPMEARRAGLQQARKEEAKRRTFDECTEDCYESIKDEFKNLKHRQQWQNTLATYASPFIGAMYVADIETDDVLRVLQPIWKDKPETASRVRGRVERVLGWAIAAKLRPPINPARLKDNLQPLLGKRNKKQDSHPALPYIQISEFLAELRQQPGVAARALEFTILTAARTNETVGAAWDEFDLTEGSWYLTAERMKMDYPHLVALSPRAAQIVEEMQDQKTCQYLFVGDKENEPMSNAAMAAVIKRMNEKRAAAGLSKWVDPKSLKKPKKGDDPKVQEKREITVHGFRSTFSDWTSETTAYSGEVREMALAHAIDNKAEASYRRGDLFEKRVHLMCDWATYCVTPRSSGDVVPIRSRAAA
jgi:integrase